MAKVVEFASDDNPEVEKEVRLLHVEERLYRLEQEFNQLSKDFNILKTKLDRNFPQGGFGKERWI